MDNTFQLEQVFLLEKKSFPVFQFELVPFPV